MLIKFLKDLHDEDGHAVIFPGALVGATGAILLAVGAVNSQNVLTIIGAVVLAVGLVASNMVQHIGVEYEIYDRLDKLEGKE